MKDFKFKKGDRIRVVKMDDAEFYGVAKYKVGDIGTIVRVNEKSEYGHCYNIKFDHLDGAYRQNWCALESWIQPEKALIVCE